MFGELPAYEAPYTFIFDYLPWAQSDGMEHRNSTILTEPARLRVPDEQLGALSTAGARVLSQLERRAHAAALARAVQARRAEPVRRIVVCGRVHRTTTSRSSCSASGLSGIDDFAASLGHSLDLVIRSPARKYRSAEEMSRFAQFVDGAVWTDPTNNDNHFVSYYDWGAVIGLGLDLSLRARTDHKVTLDDYMRRLWQEFGRAAPPSEGAVARPYTAQDLRQGARRGVRRSRICGRFFRPVRARARRARLRAASGARRLDSSEAQSRAAVDWAAVARLQRTARRAWRCRRIEDTPAYAAGLDRGDELLSFDGVAMTGRSRLDEAVERRRPGDTRAAVDSASRRRAGADVDHWRGSAPASSFPWNGPGDRSSAAESEFRTALARLTAVDRTRHILRTPCPPNPPATGRAPTLPSSPSKS